jgi:PPM family protein phosphatase
LNLSDLPTNHAELAAVAAAVGTSVFAMLLRRNRTRGREAAKGPAAESLPPASIPPPVEMPRIVFDDTDGDEADYEADSPSSVPPKVCYEEDAAVDEPTAVAPLIGLYAAAKSHTGLARKRNEDRVLSLSKHGVFAVADGMGGVHGGEIASSLAVEALESTFERGAFNPVAIEHLPRRAKEVLSAIDTANRAVFERARAQRELKGMGTTLSVARFSPRKQRLYIGHVGDSRVYRVRDGRLQRLTDDHTMAELGVGSAESTNLSRAVGLWAHVPADIVLTKVLVGDVYLLCSDGLTKMVDDRRIEKILDGAISPDEAADALVAAANRGGGVDNVSVVVVRVGPAAVAHA